MSEELLESGTGKPPLDPQVTVQTPKPPHVFISYASQDAAVADRIRGALETAGLPCWIAPRDVRAGESYAAAIVQAINSCRMLVLVLSKSAIESSHVLREIERASSKDRSVLSIRMDATPLPPDLEYFLSANQWLDASGGLEQILPALVESVSNHDTGKSIGEVLGARTAAVRGGIRFGAVSCAQQIATPREDARRRDCARRCGGWPCLRPHEQAVAVAAHRVGTTEEGRNKHGQR